MKYRFTSPVIWAALAVLPFSTAANAADIRDQLEVQTGKAELVIPDMSPQNTTTQVKDALSSWSIPASANLRSLPSTIPARPDEPSSVQKFFSGTPVIEYRCETAYAEIVKRPPPVKNAFMFAAELTQACVYPFQKGVKVYILFTSIKKTESLTSGLFNGITKAIRGQDGDWMTGQLNESIGAIKKNIPSLLVEKIEVPGMAVQEPDKEKVAALIPAKVEIPAQPITQAQTPTQVVPANPVANKIEARKNLVAMGMAYHSQEQFIAAIRRKDDVAVQLFLDGGGIDPTAKEKNGKTPVDVANEVGAKEIAKMITDRINAPAPVSAAPEASLAPVAPAQAIDAAAKKKKLDEAIASLPPDVLEELNSKLNSQNLTPEQKEQMKAQFATVYISLKQLADRIDPETGRLQ